MADITITGIPPEGRKVTDMKVTELRSILETRGLDKHGNKATLIDRLSQALKDEGLDPDTHIVEIKQEKKTPTKTSRSNSLAEADPDETLPESIPDKSLDNDHEEPEPERPAKRPAEEEPDTAEASKRICTVDIEEMHIKEELTEDDILAEEKKDGEFNGMDTEDSINIDLAEDELLNEEGEGGAKSKDGTESGVKETSQNSTVDQSSQQRDPEAGTPGDQPNQQQGASDSKDEDSAGNSSIAGAGDKKDEKNTTNKSTASSRNLWVSRLSSLTRARDLKQLCSRYGKVIGAKVVTNAKTPGSQCYGYVTMATAQQADDCISYLDKCELHGRIIYIEKAKSELGSGNNASDPQWKQRSSATDDKSSSKSDKPKKDDEEGKEKTDKPKEVKTEKTEDAKKSDSKSHVGSKSRSERSKSKKTDKGEDRRRIDKDKLKKERSPRRMREILSFNKIRREREIQRTREETRRARSEERRRRAAEQSLREMERRHRIEKQRLAMESEKLRIEMERIKHEKEMVMRMRKNENHEREQQERLERERQKIEWEKLSIAKMELKRARMRLIDDESRRGTSSKASYPAYTSKSGAATGSSTAIWSKPPSPPPPPPTSFSQTEKGRFSTSFDNGTSNYISGSEKRTSDNRSQSNRDLEKRRDYPERGYSGTGLTSSSDKRATNASDSRAAISHTASRSSGGSHSWHASSSSNNPKYSAGNSSSYESRQPLPPGTQSRNERYASERDNYDSTTSGRDQSASYHSSSQRSNYKEHRYVESSRPQGRVSSEANNRSSTAWHGASSSSAAAKGSSSSHHSNSWQKSSREWPAAANSSSSTAFYSNDYSGNVIKYPVHQPAPPGSSPFHDNAYQQRGDYRQKY